MALLTRAKAVNVLLRALQASDSDLVGSSSLKMSKALAVQCQGAELSVEAAAELATCVQSIPWADKLHLTAVMSALANNAGDGDAGASDRRKMQDFRLCPLYITTDVCTMLMKAGPSTCNVLIEYLVAKLGLRCPSEKTVQIIAAFVYWIVGETCVLLEEAFAQVQFIKKKIKFLAAKAGRDIYLESLPPMPSVLFEEHNQFYTSIFGDEQPYRLSSDQMAAIEDIARYIPMRSTKRNAGISSSSSMPQGQLIPFKPKADVQQEGNMSQMMMMMMMQCCQQMMKGQMPPEKAAPKLNILKGNLKNAIGAADDILQPPDKTTSCIMDERPLLEFSVKKEAQADVAVKKEAQPVKEAAPYPSPMEVEAAPKEKDVEEAEEAKPAKAGGSVHDTALKLLEQIKKKNVGVAVKGKKVKKGKGKAKQGGGKVDEKMGKAAYTFEDSRKQIMCRTGLGGPGSTYRIQFKESGGRDKAIALADKWMKKENERQAKA